MSQKNISQQISNLDDAASVKAFFAENQLVSFSPVQLNELCVKLAELCATYNFDAYFTLALEEWKRKKQ